MTFDDLGRECSQCLIYQPWAEFYKLARGLNGRHAACRSCARKKAQVHKARDPDALRRMHRESKRRTRAADSAREAAACRRWREKNKEHIARKNRAYYEKNTDRVKASVRAYLAANPEKAKAWQQNYRARRRAGGLLTGAQVHKVLFRSRVCFYCEKAFTLRRRPTLDHVIPLSKGGTNQMWNLVACCRSCNSSKRERPLAVWEPPVGRRLVAEKLAILLAL